MPTLFRIIIVAQYVHRLLCQLKVPRSIPGVPSSLEIYQPGLLESPSEIYLFISRHRCQLICGINQLIVSNHLGLCQRCFGVVSVGILSVQNALSMHWKMNWLIGTLRVGQSLMTRAAFLTMAFSSDSSLGMLGVR